MKEAKLSNGGRVVIPAEIRHALGIQDGDTLLFDLRDGEVRVTSRRTQMRRAQSSFQQLWPKDGPSPVDELIAERRAEACKE